MHQAATILLLLTLMSNRLLIGAVSLQGGLFAEAGVTKIRLTGGEPTLKRDIEDLVGNLAALPGVTDVGLTTNGIALSRKLPALQAAGAFINPHLAWQRLHPVSKPGIVSAAWQRAGSL